MIKTFETDKIRRDEYGILRFVMACMVMIMHYNKLIFEPKTEIIYMINGEGFVGKLLYGVLLICIMFGSRATDCFFVLSGYVISTGYYTRITKGEITFQRFMERRIRRLYPLLIASVLLMALLQWIYYYMMERWWTGREATFWDVFVSLTGISVGTVFNTMDTLNGPIWYISVLMICYFLFWIIGKQGNKYMFLLPVAVGLAIDTYKLNLPFLTAETSRGYVGFFVGCILFLAKDYIDEKRAFRITSFFVILLVIATPVIYGDDYLFVLGNSLWITVLFFPSVLVFFSAASRATIFRSSICSFCGRISFPLFLLHIPSLMIAEFVIGLNTEGREMSIFETALIIAFVLSILWIFIEKVTQHSFRIFV